MIKPTNTAKTIKMLYNLYLLVGILLHSYSTKLSKMKQVCTLKLSTNKYIEIQRYIYICMHMHVSNRSSFARLKNPCSRRNYHSEEMMQCRSHLSTGTSQGRHMFLAMWAKPCLLLSYQYVSN